MKVHAIQTPLSMAYLVETRTGLFLVDTGAQGSERFVMKKIQSLGRKDLKLIFITHAHFDHYGSAASLRRITGALITIHQADADAMAHGLTPVRSARNLGRLGLIILRTFYPLFLQEPTKADLLLDDSESLERFGLRATLLHTPGHTPGSSSLLVEGRLAFVGDLISSLGWPSLQRNFADDWYVLPNSLARLQALKPEWVYPGHGSHPLNRESFVKLTE